MKLIFKTALLLSILLFHHGCAIPFPLDAEPPESKTPPKFLRDYCEPNFTTTVNIDSTDKIYLRFVVEDPDFEDEIPFRIYKDYYTCTDAESDPSDCNQTLITMSAIPPNDPNTLNTMASDDPNNPYRYGIYTRNYQYPITKNIFCNSDQGDVSGSTHIIEVVITDAFSNSADQLPFWRSTIGGSDVWSFVVRCVKNLKSGENSNENEPQ